jgi:hypothetical protein
MRVRPITMMSWPSGLLLTVDSYRRDAKTATGSASSQAFFQGVALGIHLGRADLYSR